MANPYMYNSYYSPSLPNSQLNTSPTFGGSQYKTLSSSLSSSSSSSSNYSYALHNPRLRYYLSKSFDAEDDLEFCPDIPDYVSSPSLKRFNPYTALVFSPTAVSEHGGAASGPRGAQGALTPRVRKPIEIVNPHTKSRSSTPMAK